MSDDIVDEIVRDVELREGGFSFNDFNFGIHHPQKDSRYDWKRNKISF